MFTGIITDRFGKMRDEEADQTKDEKSSCFICGKSKDEIEKKGENFIYHTEETHNRWNYVFYIEYLLKKKGKCPESLNADEI